MIESSLLREVMSELDQYARRLRVEMERRRQYHAELVEYGHDAAVIWKDLQAESQADLHRVVGLSARVERAYFQEAYGELVKQENSAQAPERPTPAQDLDLDNPPTE